LQGCGFGCAGCHNPALQDYNGGTAMEPESVVGEISRNPLITGVTFSGGEPMEQAAALIPVATTLKERGYNLWIYTGYRWEALNETQRSLAKLADVVADGLFVLERRTLSLPWRGSDNQRLIDVKRSGGTEVVEWEGAAATARPRSNVINNL
jgi:anaerobic ribonucleoside-triphosphate reductase activating protein